MAISISAPLTGLGAFPIDERMVKTKAEMRSTNDNVMPSVYLALCDDDGELYLYKKSNTFDEETGKYRLHEGGLERAFVSVDTLPETGEVGVIYLVPNGSTGSSVKDEYIWIPDEDLPEGGYYEKIGSTDIDLSIGETFTTNVEVGGISSGTEIKDTDGIVDVIKKMLTKVYYPTFVNPSATISYSVPSLLKVGSIIRATRAAVDFNPGAINLQGVKQNNRAGADISHALSSSGADQDFDVSAEAGILINVPTITRSTKGNVTVSGSVSFEQGPQPKDSNGEDYGEPLAAGSVSAPNKIIEFIYPFYHGVNVNSSIVDFTGLTEDLSKKGNKNYSYTGNNEYPYLVYDAAYGDLANIKDANGFENIQDWTKTTLEVGGYTYNVYKNKFAITGTQSYTFIF